jgi:hypothetical protein
MYIKKDRGQQKQIEFVSIEDLVPQDHILREIDRAMDFSFIYEEVNGLYAPLDWGKPGIDRSTGAAIPERTGQGYAYFRVHEFKKAGNMETKKREEDCHTATLFQAFYLRGSMHNKFFALLILVTQCSSDASVAAFTYRYSLILGRTIIEFYCDVYRARYSLIV